MTASVGLPPYVNVVINFFFFLVFRKKKDF